MSLLSADQVASINEVLGEWRQGDFVLGECWFIFQVEEGGALTTEGAEALEAGLDTAAAEVLGLCVVTQTCDLVRDCKDRPFVEVAPIVEIPKPDALRQIVKGFQPRYATFDNLSNKQLAVDLDRTMTVEKSVIARWQRTVGCRSENEELMFAAALSRKRSRPAFPDEFVEWMQPLTKRFRDKHSKMSPEGDLLRAVKEIRVCAEPNWAAPEVEVTFYFIFDYDRDIPTDKLEEIQKSWESLLTTKSTYSPCFIFLTLDDLVASEYVQSVRLDLDHLSLTHGDT